MTAQDRIDPLLMESVYSAANRSLVNEPLTVDDWDQVYTAQRAFIAQVRMIVVNARSRALDSEDEREYCLHMDSGAAWHIIGGVNVGRCPDDGCELGH